MLLIFKDQKVFSHAIYIPSSSCALRQTLVHSGDPLQNVAFWKYHYNYKCAFLLWIVIDSYPCTENFEMITILKTWNAPTVPKYRITLFLFLVPAETGIAGSKAVWGDMSWEVAMAFAIKPNCIAIKRKKSIRWHQYFWHVLIFYYGNA